MKTLIAALFLNVFCYASNDTCIVILHKKTTMRDVVKQKFNFDNLFLYNDTLYDKAFLKSKNVVWNDSLENEMISKIDYKIFKFYRDGTLIGCSGWHTEALFGKYLQYDKLGKLRIEGWYSAERWESRCGVWTFYNRNGKVRKTKTYRNDKAYFPL